MAFKKRKGKAKSKPPVEPKLDPVGFDEVPEAKAEEEAPEAEGFAGDPQDLVDLSPALKDWNPNLDKAKLILGVDQKSTSVPPRPHGAPPPEHCSHEFPGSEGKEFVYVIKPEHRDKYPSKKLVIPVD